ncbi:MAG TPA: hypothetical protein VM425_03265 [Myxococcota bacterium]|nr:hypothetical protein [Myxococcota bacterium]
MRAKWWIGIGLSVLLGTPSVIAGEPEGEAALKKIQKQEQKQEQQKAQEQKRIEKKDKLQAQEQNRNRYRHRKGNGKVQGDTNAVGEGNSGAENSSGNSQPTVDPADDTQLVDQNGDGIGDQVQSQDRGKKGNGEKGAMKRGHHRYHQRKSVGTAAQQGERNQMRTGKGFGRGFVDSDGNGVNDSSQKRKGT